MNQYRPPVVVFAAAAAGAVALTTVALVRGTRSAGRHHCVSTAPASPGPREPEDPAPGVDDRESGRSSQHPRIGAGHGLLIVLMLLPLGAFGLSAVFAVAVAFDRNLWVDIAADIASGKPAVDPPSGWNPSTIRLFTGAGLVLGAPALVFLSALRVAEARDLATRVTVTTAASGYVAAIGGLVIVSVVIGVPASHPLSAAAIAAATFASIPLAVRAVEVVRQAKRHDPQRPRNPAGLPSPRSRRKRS